MPMSVTILYANNENIGDLLSAVGIRTLMGGEATMFPFEGRSVATSRMLNGLREGDTLIVGGGGLLKATFDRTWEQVLVAQDRRGFNTVLWGVGYCDVIGSETKGSLALHRDAVSRAALAGFRDELSWRPFLDVDHASVIGCPSGIAVRGISRGGRQSHAAGHVLQVDHPDLLRSVSLRYGADAEAAIVAATSGLAARMRLPLVPTANLIAGTPLAPRVKARLAASRWEIRGAELMASRVVREKYAKAEVVVTSRLHGAIIAATLGKKVVALSGDAKIGEYMVAIGLKNFVVHDPAELADVVDRLDQQPSTEESIQAFIDGNERFAHAVRSEVRAGALQPPKDLL